MSGTVKFELTSVRPEKAPGVRLVNVNVIGALPELDANANAIAIQTLRLENEGWERDYEVVEPREPAFNEPG